MSSVQRRQFIVASGTALATGALAGCTGEGSDDSGDGSEASGSNDNSSGDGGSDDSSGSDSGSGLTIEEHELVADDYSVNIEGVVLNDSGEEKSYVEIEALVYNADDQQIESTFTNTENLGDGKEWAFELMLTSEESEIDEYELSVTDSV